MRDLEDVYFHNRRTEEVQHIIDKMPNRFGAWISGIVLFLFLLILTFGWLIRYPDIVNGQIVVSANSAPLKLISGTSGKLKLSIKSMEDVKEGQVFAYIENPTNPTNVIFIDNLLRSFNPNSDSILSIIEKLPQNFSLGELNTKYYTFANVLQEFINYKKDKMLEKQEESYHSLLNEQKTSISTAAKRVEMAKNSLAYAYKFFRRDSLLFVRKVISEAEFDKMQMSYLSSKDGLQNSINNLTNAKQAAQQTESKIQELGIQKPEKEKELQIALISAYNDLVDSIKSWEQKYVFKAPFNGKIQFLKFYNQNQFVQAGEEVFTLVPEAEGAFGEVVLPARGSGKIELGQEVIVKLDNYPYLEYGSISGRIKSISLTTNLTKTEKTDVETYMVLVDFPNQLKTNYGTKLDFKAGAKGSAEIITHDRRLIQRLFDNIKYVLKK